MSKLARIARNEPDADILNSQIDLLNILSDDAIALNYAYYDQVTMFLKLEPTSGDSAAKKAFDTKSKKILYQEAKLVKKNAIGYEKYNTLFDEYESTPKVSEKIKKIDKIVSLVKSMKSQIITCTNNINKMQEL